MKQRPPGDGQQDSAIGLSCMGLSFGLGTATDKQEALAVFRRAVGRGVTLFDAAEALEANCVIVDAMQAAGRPGLHAGRAVVGPDRLHAGLWQPVAAGRPCRRHPGPAADVRGGPGHLHLGLAGDRAGAEPCPVARSPRRPGHGLGGPGPSTLALLSTHFAEGPERTRALSLHAAAAGIGATLGLVLDGLLADLLSWRAGYFINLPIGLALIVAARRCIVESPRRTGHFDVAGAISSTLGMTALVYGLVRAAEQG